MNRRAQLLELLDAHPSGMSLPRPLYHDPTAFDLDMNAIFATQWLFACSGAEIHEPGDHVTVAVGRESVIVLRDEAGSVRAYHNSCRHRGSRICLEHRGSSSRLVCPYHQWTYGLDGALVHAQQMGEDFDPSEHALAPVHVETVCGMIYICLADAAPDFERFRRAVAPHIAPHAPERTKVAFQSRIVEQANWKLVIENNRECYHCAANHPELLASLVEFAPPGEPDALYDALMERKRPLWEAAGLTAENVVRDLEFRCVRLPFEANAVSMTRDGGPACKMLLGDLVEPDLGSVRMFHAPNNWNHFLSDHIIHFRCNPMSESETEVVTTWLVHEDAIEGLDYDIERLTEVWIATNDEDRQLAENNHLGTASRAYRPGPYSKTEFLVKDFADWYLAAMRRERSDAYDPMHLVAAE